MKLKTSTIRKMSAGDARAKWKHAQLRRSKRPRCCACKRSFDKRRPPTVDHIIPLSKGGRDDKSNWQLMCRPCDMSKGNSLPTKEQS